MSEVSGRHLRDVAEEETCCRMEQKARDEPSTETTTVTVSLLQSTRTGVQSQRRTIQLIIRIKSYRSMRWSQTECIGFTVISTYVRESLAEG